MDNIPHQSVINVTIYYELCERLNNGQVGTTVKNRGKQSIPFTVKGNTLEECQQLTNELITKLKERINDKNQSPSNSPRGPSGVDATIEETNGGS